MAHSVSYASTMSAQHILDCNYNVNTNMWHLPPLPIPLIETDTTGVAFLDISRYVSIVIPISLGQFNDKLEEHISTGLVPKAYMGIFNTLDDNVWLLLHNHPLPKQDRTYAAIVYPKTNCKLALNEGILPALQMRFHLPMDGYRHCIH
jgi:hypothetical protein